MYDVIQYSVCHSIAPSSLSCHSFGVHCKQKIVDFLFVRTFINSNNTSLSAHVVLNSRNSSEIWAIFLQLFQILAKHTLKLHWLKNSEHSLSNLVYVAFVIIILFNGNGTQSWIKSLLA